MRQFRFTLTPTDGHLNSFSRAVRERDDVERVAIRWLNRQRDGAATACYRMTGRASALDDLLARATDIETAETFNEGPDGFDLYLHFRPDGPGAALLAVVDEYNLVLEMPIEFGPNGRLEVTVAGTDADVQAAVAAVPDDIAVDVEQVTEYEPGRWHVRSELTERQREVVRAAIGLGYYDAPRRATQAEVAERVGCSATTAGSHLRKAEATVLRALFDVESPADDPS